MLLKGKGEIIPKDAFIIKREMQQIWNSGHASLRKAIMLR
jgi:hypothetical protein